MKYKRCVRGDRRIDSYFAIIPVAIGSDVRWLETVTVRQRCRNGTFGTYWEDEEFIDNPKDTIFKSKTSRMNRAYGAIRAPKKVPDIGQIRLVSKFVVFSVTTAKGDVVRFQKVLSKQVYTAGKFSNKWKHVEFI